MLWWQYNWKWDVYSNSFSGFERGYARNMHFDFEQNHKNIQVCSLNVAHSTIKLSWGGEEIGLTQITLFIQFTTYLSCISWISGTVIPMPCVCS